MTNDSVFVRDLREAACAIIAQAFAAQGWNKPEAQYRRYLEECRPGSRVVLVADVARQFAGYIGILWQFVFDSSGA